ncbi:unnamed protein product [Strongylus vulgaris]|uniref:Serine-threonine/tyrosine-protein kinase catalytic domain-containing protein n=1 Tax=Strongylus vulgaris TaxID=40348 RepID=A0A3P7J3B4_STRVU|nr:unnamed protein product [Strongylus vulgaris]
MTNAAIPYEGLPNAKVKEMMLQGKHNKFPPETDPGVVKLVETRCWLRDPASRCTMNEAAKVMVTLTGIPRPPMSTYTSREIVPRKSSSLKLKSSRAKSMLSKRNLEARVIVSDPHRRKVK